MDQRLAYVSRVKARIARLRPCYISLYQQENQSGEEAEDITALPCERLSVGDLLTGSYLQYRRHEAGMTAGQSLAIPTAASADSCVLTRVSDIYIMLIASLGHLFSWNSSPSFFPCHPKCFGSFAKFPVTVPPQPQSRKATVCTADGPTRLTAEVMTWSVQIGLWRVGSTTERTCYVPR